MTDRSPSPALVRSAPENAYLWGRIFGDGAYADRPITVRVGDRRLAERLATVLSQPTSLSEETTATQSAHDVSVTRIDESFELQIHCPPAQHARITDRLDSERDRENAPTLQPFTSHRKQLVRALLESCGTVCFRESAGTVGVSFVHEDRRLLERIVDQLGACPPAVSTKSIERSSGGGHWVGLTADSALEAFTRWVYAGSDERGLYETARRQKLRRSVERAHERSVGELHGDPE